MNETVKAVDLEPVKADAELMSAWLGGVDNVTISPKLLFDLQSLLRHYADFLVPDLKVSIDYEYEGCPCASVDKNQIFIPVDMLQEGRVDETISAVIHEIHHLKFSDGERSICDNIFPYVERILSTVEISHHGKKMSVWDALTSHGKVCPKEIITRTSEHMYSAFVYQFFGDLFLLLNAIEDVRIDELQPHNLKKYRFKQEKNAFEKFTERIKDEEIDVGSMYGKMLLALFHYKGLVNSPVIEETGFSAEDIHSVERPIEYFPPTFKAFGKSIQDHAGALWKEYEKQTSLTNSAVSDFLVSEVGDSQDGGKPIKEDKEMNLKPKKASDCSDLDGNFVEEIKKSLSEDWMKDFVDAMKVMGKPGEGGDIFDSGDRVVLSQESWAEIQAFRRIKHIPCREEIKEAENGIEYDTLIFDCYA